MTRLSPSRAAIYLTNIWQNHGPNEYPIDVEALIHGAIVESSFPGTLRVEKGVFESFEGCLKRIDETDDWIILLNLAVENSRRIRFTLAHELGHYMCHRGISENFEDGLDSLNDFRTEVEREANLFAASLLLPANLIRVEFPDRKWHSEVLCGLGNRFESSLQASGARFVELASKPVAFIVSRDGCILWATKSKSSPFLSAFCCGDELPQDSFAFEISNGKDINTHSGNFGCSWTDDASCVETHYLDSSGRDFQYTCIEFL